MLMINENKTFVIIIVYKYVDDKRKQNFYYYITLCHKKILIKY